MDPPLRETMLARGVKAEDAFGTKSRVNPDVAWNGAFLPTAGELNVLPKK